MLLRVARLAVVAMILAGAAGAEKPGAAWDVSSPQPVVAEPDAAGADRAPAVVQRHPAAAFGSGVYLVAWCEGSRQADRPTADIYCARIDARSGQRLDPRGVRVCAAADVQEWPAVAFDGANFLVVWQDFRSATRYDVYAARVTPQGKVLDPDGFAVAAGPANQCRPGVAFASGRWLVAWMDARTYPLYGIYAARIAPDATVLDPGGVPLDVEDEAKVAAARPPERHWMGDRDYWWNHLSSRYLPVVASDGRKWLVVYLREYPFAENPRPSPTALLVEPEEARVEAGPARLPGGAYSGLAACATPDGWTVVLADHATGWGLAARLAAVRLDRELNTRDAFAPPHTKEPDRLPVEALETTLMPEDAASLNPGKGALCFWRPAAVWDERQVVVALDFGWRDRRDPKAITYVVACNRVAPGAERFAEPASRVLADSRRADQAVANPALAAGPGGQVLLVYERDESVERQVIEHRLLRPR